MKDEQNPQGNKPLNLEQTTNIVYLMANVCFWLVAPFVRCGFGQRAGRMAVLYAFLGLMTTAMLCRSYALTVGSDNHRNRKSG